MPCKPICFKSQKRIERTFLLFKKPLETVRHEPRCCMLKASLALSTKRPFLPLCFLLILKVLHISKVCLQESLASLRNGKNEERISRAGEMGVKGHGRKEVGGKKRMWERRWDEKGLEKGWWKHILNLEMVSWKEDPFTVAVNCCSLKRHMGATPSPLGSLSYCWLLW